MILLQGRWPTTKVALDSSQRVTGKVIDGQRITTTVGDGDGGEGGNGDISGNGSMVVW